MILNYDVSMGLFVKGTHVLHFRGRVKIEKQKHKNDIQSLSFEPTCNRSKVALPGMNRTDILPLEVSESLTRGLLVGKN